MKHITFWRGKKILGGGGGGERGKELLSEGLNGVVAFTVIG